METKLIVIGSNSYSDYMELKSICTDFIKHLIIDGMSELGEVEILNGAFYDFGSLVMKYAKEHRLRIRGFLIGWVSMNFKWSNHTEEMFKYATEGNHCDVIAFWDGKDTLTKEVLKLAEVYKVNTYINLI